MVWIFIAGVIVIISVMLGSYFLGPQHINKTTALPYESGIVSTGTAHIRFPVHFYLIAVFFVIFDLESIFIYAYAASAKFLGFESFVRILLFSGVLLLTLVYLFKVGAFNIGPKLRKAGESHEL